MSAVEVKPGTTATEQSGRGSTPRRRGTSMKSAMRALEWAMACVAVGLAALALWRLLHTANRGLDFTDEGMYLLSADAHSRTASFNNAFGRYTRLMYELVGFDIARFRMLSELLLAVAAAALGDRVAVASARLRRTTVGYAVRIAVAAAIVAAALHYYLSDLTTPSYNWLNLVGILVLCAGFLDAVTRRPERRWWVRWAGPVFMALGALVATMGKVSSGPALLVLAAVGILLVAPVPMRERWLTLARTAGAGLGLLVAHTLLVNPPWVTARQISRGQRNLIELDPAHYKLSNAVRDVTDSFTMVRHQVWHVAGAGLWIALAAAVVACIWPLRSRIVVAPLAGLAIVLASARLFHLKLWAGSNASYFVLAWVPVIMLGVSLLFLPGVVRALPRDRGRALAGFVVVVGVLAAGAASYAFGSGNGFFAQLNGGLAPMVAAALFVLLGVCLPNGTPLPALVMTIALGVGAYTVVGDAIASPYRQPPLSQQTAAVQIGPHGSLKVDPGTAAYINDIRAAAARAGWVKGTPLLDFSPYSAGTVYALGGRPPLTILPSVGYYPTTTHVAFWAMDQLVKAGWKDDFRSAWVLTQLGLPNPGPAPDTNALLVIGRNFPADYEQVGTFYLPRQGTIALWRPKAG
jgi:hypothetical protein